jgi:predicted glycoside hydrolase/deacetylase ChbG (UPF0249 family)
MRQLFVNADDFGLHDDINRAVADGVRQGRIQGVSVSVNGPAVDWPLLRDLTDQGAAIGLHLTWVDEAWLTGAGAQPRATVVRNLLIRPTATSHRLRMEARAQVECFVEHGFRPAHVDSHQHIHVLPRLWAITLELAREYYIPRIRLPMAASSAGVRRSPGGILLQLLCRYRHVGMPSAWPCVGIAHSGHNTADHVCKELMRSNSPKIELVAHPAFATESLCRRYPYWGYDWDAERTMLMADNWPHLLEGCGFEART